ncbi:MAG: radical SAM protein [Treponemataceae bacterium]|nr:radical SAM protein [Treponemataceae bacterium]
MSGGSSSSYSSCAHCPRNCGANRSGGKTGFCGETEAVRIALACLHFGEEPPVTASGGSGTIFFTGCTLRCAFCQNYQISQQGMGRAVSSDEFTEICLRLQSAGAENINLVTGSHMIPRLAEYIRAAQRDGCAVPFCWNSSAYERPELLEHLKDCVKIWLPDLKTLDGALARQLFAAEDYPETAAAAVQWMILHFPPKFSADGRGNGGTSEKMEQGVIVRHLFLPGRFAETADVLRWLKENADGRALISLMSQYTPVPFRETSAQAARRSASLAALENRPVSADEDGDLRDLIAAFDFEQLFYQELSDDASWLPDFSQARPFPNKLAVPIWHWNGGFA